MKKAIAVLLAVLLLVSITACGGEALVGKYSLYSMEAEGTTMYADDLTAYGVDLSGFSLEVRSDGTFIMSMPDDAEGQTAEGTWEKSGSSYSFTVDGDVVDAKYDASNQTITLSTDGEVITFKK